jgi:hypothetical protein
MLDGSRSARACLARRWGLSVGAAGERLLLAARLREAPATRAAFARGDLSYDKARALCTAVAEDLPEEAKEAFRDAEADLVTAAQALSVGQLREVMGFWRASVDPDGEDDRADDRYAKRGLSVVETFDGMVHLEGCLDPEQGQLVLRVLQSIESRFWRADHHDRNDQSGSACPEDCEHESRPRTDRQRRADALVEACRLASMYDPATDTFDGRGADRPRVAAIIDLDALGARGGATSAIDGAAPGTVGRSMLADCHQPLSSDAVGRLLCDSVVSGVVLDHQQVPLVYTHGKGQVSPGLRAAVVLRDGTCAMRGCKMPPRACDVHHVTWRSKGGEHSIHNCCLLCHHHHRLMHEGGWRVVIDVTTGRPCFQDPGGNWHGAEPSPLQLASLATTARSP